MNIDIDMLFREAQKKMGVANVLIAGKTGVGKSTLLNKVFDSDFADTAQGRPVTQETKKYTKEDVPIAIYDTKGLEVKDYSSILKSLRSFIETCKSENHNDHIHVAWVCIAEGSRRIEAAEIDLVKMLDQLGVPVIVVITKACQDNGFKDQVDQLLPETRQIVRVRALLEEYDDGHISQPMGLDTLVKATIEVLPEGQRNAFVAAQQIFLAAKRSRAQKATHTAAITAGTIAATPIPFSDAAALAPVQIGMLATISYIYDCNFTDGFFKTMLAAVIGVGGAALAGRAIVGGLLKLIPGVGTLAGGVLASTTAIALTELVGHAYITTLESLIESNGSLRNVTQDQIAEAFKSELRRSKGI